MEVPVLMAISKRLHVLSQLLKSLPLLSLSGFLLPLTVWFLEPQQPTCPFSIFFFFLLSLPFLPWQWLLNLALAFLSENEKPTHHFPMPLDVSSCSLHLFPGLGDTERIPGMSFLDCEMCLNRKWYYAHQFVIWA